MIPAFPFCPYLFNLFLTLHVRLGYELPWEDVKFVYPNNMAPPLEIGIEASNGASDYGNKFGEPVLAGFARSFGMMLPNGERREWVKPIMFSGGIGMIDGEGVTKLQPEKGKNIFPKINKERQEMKQHLVQRGSISSTRKSCSVFGPQAKLFYETPIFTSFKSQK